ncbi:alternative ribosome rescue aminoacyl-tRNA hydrolase ArfB [Marinirhabdus gelatinilytica]|uniref:Ribosome-associated protein n=1 Tax=Marinirhabdus gelatinilytica TaxID=1703343 RepID=A0A370QK97_9FLAO|nr:alternative ribosome rescue aminoacyl-tRNA hydrolase ArfB [Marinirhabdus gelatinilytica]RDK88803.1 ribosome-associated protein [Marinirhabdus gelatinilytica]
MDTSQIVKELQYKAIRSSGAGGQHVNKTATKVEVTFSIANSQGLTETEKELLNQRLSSRITLENTLVLQCGTTRSQSRNKTLVTKRLLELLEQNSKPKKKRKKTKPSKSAIEKRLREKKKKALKKSNRRPPEI